MVRDKTFREDLFYRINLITLRLPALRQRLDDIPLLADWFAQQYAARTSTRSRRLTDAACRWLQTQPFPGNIRQLRNMVERAIIVSDAPEIDVDTFAGLAPDEAASSSETGASPRLGDMERTAVAEAIAAAGGNLSLAAASLGLSRQALYRRMEKYGLK